MKSDLQAFWSRMAPGFRIHPDDKPFLDRCSDHTFRTDHRPPTPFDGPLYSAKVVVCYANPGFSEEDQEFEKLISRQLTGHEPLPDIAHWVKWYEPRFRSIGLPFSEFRGLIAIFNVCPYASVRMTDTDVRLASGLPSVWAAQRHLRDVLIPQARAGNLFLVIARKHQLWGISDGFDTECIRLTRNIGGYLSEGNVGVSIRNWLKRNGHALLDP